MTIVTVESNSPGGGGAADQAGWLSSGPEEASCPPSCRGAPLTLTLRRRIRTFTFVRVSGFNFLRNAQSLGYPFVESIRSVLPIVDEFVIALGRGTDGTEAELRAIGDPKIRIIPTEWNEAMRNDYSVKGYVFGQQKSIALFNCTGDWAFYLEGDEVLHEADLPGIREAMERHLSNGAVEALVFKYLHFYGNKNTVAWSPRWYRTAPRIIRNTIPTWAPEGLFFVVLDTLRKGRYPRAVELEATIYHYGWVRTESQMNRKREQVEKFWSDRMVDVDYSAIDPQTLRPFTGTHPRVVQRWLPPAEGLFRANPDHRLTRREKRHRWIMRLERWLRWQYKRKHYRLAR